MATSFLKNNYEYYYLIKNHHPFSYMTSRSNTSDSYKKPKNAISMEVKKSSLF